MARTRQPSRTQARFIGPREDWHHNACVNYQHDPAFTIAAGYRKAAEIVADNALDRSGLPDQLVYPIVFLSRHYLELTIKLIVRDGFALMGEPAPAIISKSHKVDDLWKHARRAIESAFEGEDLSELDEAGDFIAEIASVDPGSFSFRYSEKRDGRGALPPELRHINIAQFRERMALLEELLEGALCGICVYLEQKNEYESEMQALYGY